MIIRRVNGLFCFKTLLKLETILVVIAVVVVVAAVVLESSRLITTTSFTRNIKIITAIAPGIKA